MNPAIWGAILTGFKLLPHFVVGVETLWGKKTGESKKQAVTDLFNASVVGTATGLGAAGDTTAAQSLVQVAPALSASIDNLAATLFPDHTSAAA